MIDGDYAKSNLSLGRSAVTKVKVCTFIFQQIFLSGIRRGVISELTTVDSFEFS